MPITQKPASNAKPAPKVHATKTRPAEQARGTEHDERVMDEAIDESFPASDPAAIVSPGSTVAVRNRKQKGK
jgi:hypothetical protein